MATPTYVVEELTEDRVALVYPLIQAMWRTVTPERWLAFGRGRYRDGPAAPRVLGMRVALNPRGDAQGFFCYAVIEDSPHGRCLRCDHFAALQMVGLGSPVPALVAAAEDLACRHHCEQLNLCLPSELFTSPRSLCALHTDLRASGHRMDSLNFSKSMAGAREHQP